MTRGRVAQRFHEMFFVETPEEYIICLLFFVGSRRVRRVPHPLPFKGAGFDFSAGSVVLLCAILCGGFMDAETFTLSPLVVTGADRIWELRARETAL